jgi:hypothetical protein
MLLIVLFISPVLSPNKYLIWLKLLILDNICVMIIWVDLSFTVQKWK